MRASRSTAHPAPRRRLLLAGASSLCTLVIAQLAVAAPTDAAKRPLSPAANAPSPAAIAPSPAVVAPSAKALAQPSGLVVRFTPGEIVADNIRATGSLYAAGTLDELKLFEVVDRIVDAFRSGLLPIRSKESAARLESYFKARADRVPKPARDELVRFVAELVQTVFDQIVTDSAKQMEAYAALVRSVSDSLDQFRRDNTTENQGRDSLADRFPEESWKVPADLARSLSKHGYGATRFASAKIEQQLRDALAIVSDPAVLAAYGVRNANDLLEKLGGKPAAEAERIQRRAEAGARLIASLADNADLLEAPKQRAELARRLAAAAPHAKAWLVVKPPGAPAKVPPTVPPKVVRPLCLDAQRNFVPCTVTKR